MGPILAVLSTGALAAAAVGERPNVVLILADDLGAIDLGCQGASDLYTPHLDALARDGVRFTQLYSAAPVCSPSRAALLTGRCPQRAGVPANVAPGATGLPASEVTIAESLRAAGYATALIGKWHLGTALGRGPLDQGFDRFFGHRQGCIDNYSHFFHWSGPSVHDLWRDDAEQFEDGTHFSDLMVREATRFLEERQDRPFFLYLPFNIPHYPYQATREHRERFAHLAEPRRSYAAFVAQLDESVGRILGKLDELALRRRTIVAFLSDHGHSIEERAMRGGGSAGPFRGAKFSLFEGGIRVPAIMSWPGKLPRGETREQVSTTMDLLPTLLDLCGVPLSERPLDGRSLVPLLRSASAPSPHETLHWQTEGRGGPQWAVRQGRWKLIANPLDEALPGAGTASGPFLADLERDPGERQNLAASEPEVVARLTALHEDWARGVAAAARRRVLIVTGQDHPSHDWRATAPALRELLEQEGRLEARIVEDPVILESSALGRYDAIVLHFQDWEQPPPGELARANLLRYVEAGGGLVAIHFACGAFDGWPEYERLVGRVWDKVHTHDPRGPFRVEVLDVAGSPLAGLASYTTDDELYLGLTGATPIEVLAQARSKVTGRDHPMAFTLRRGHGRVFHTALGHDVNALRNPGTAELLRRGLGWATGN